MSELDSLIGSSISLITQNDVRYDGNLFSINAQEASIILRDVRCFGTEDRVSDPSKKVSANPQKRAFVTFLGQDIKDLYVHEPTADDNSNTQAPASVAPVPSNVSPSTSAPPASVPSSTSVPTSTTPATVSAPTPASVPSSQPVPPKPPVDDFKSHNQGRDDNHGGRGRGGGRGGGRGYDRQGRGNSAAGTGEHLLRAKEQKPVQSKGPNKQTLKSEFDFTVGLNNFNKEAVLAEVASDANEVNKYIKDDFFDSFSGSGDGRMTFAEERKLNQDTFGISSLRNNYRGRGGGRGRGSSNNGHGHGYGRGRGNGGGGHHQGGRSTGSGSFAKKEVVA